LFLLKPSISRAVTFVIDFGKIVKEKVSAIDRLVWELTQRKPTQV
jgi:hypothetical protein